MTALSVRLECFAGPCSFRLELRSVVQQGADLMPGPLLWTEASLQTLTVQFVVTTVTYTLTTPRQLDPNTKCDRWGCGCWCALQGGQGRRSLSPP